MIVKSSRLQTIVCERADRREYPAVPALEVTMTSAAAKPTGWPAMPVSAGPVVAVPGGPPRRTRAAGGITLGVEEEFVLLDPSTGSAVLAGPDLARMLDQESGIRPELMRYQVETATGVCTSLDEVGRELIRLRQLAADACLLAATGIAPYRAPGWPP